jgi:pimeloyl-ACP methyl ester carboxylesterase
MVVALPDGRSIGVAEYGPARGRPVLWFHGTPGGRHQIPEALRASVHERDVRLVVVERPGYGDSTQHLHRNIREFSTDIEHLVDALELDRFGVAALSGGGPYSLGVGHALGDRVVAVSILGGVVPQVGPESQPGGLVSMFAPIAGLARLTAGPVGSALGFAVWMLGPFGDPVFRAVTAMFPPGDQLVFSAPDMKDMFLGDLRRTARGGLPGPLIDLVLFTREWGFPLAEVRVPVHFWQGDADPIVTLDQARSMADAVPASTFIVRPGESHLGGFATATEAIEAILDHWSG